MNMAVHPFGLEYCAKTKTKQQKKSESMNQLGKIKESKITKSGKVYLSAAVL